MNTIRCSSCGFLNWVDAEVCKRCGQSTYVGYDRDGYAEEEPEKAKPGILKRALIVLVVCFVILIGFYVSLCVSSDPITLEQRATVDKAIDMLDEKGFSQEVFTLRHLVNFRSRDNWWNNWMGHTDAYAATNFPFEFVTLYPDFFKVPVDERERAIILLHEAHHLRGDGEEKALSEVWHEKQRLGWTRATYAETNVWKNVREYTEAQVPRFFQCGADAKSDCFE
jgi:hypothetical protein